MKTGDGGNLCNFLSVVVTPKVDISGGRAHQKLVSIAGTSPTAFRLFCMTFILFLRVTGLIAANLICCISHCSHTVLELLSCGFSTKSNYNWCFCSFFFATALRHFCDIVKFFNVCWCESYGYNFVYVSLYSHDVEGLIMMIPNKIWL